MSNYSCSNCGLKSKVKGNIKRHIINIEECKKASIVEDVKKVKCVVCEKEYNTELLLKQHQKVCVAKKAIVVDKFKDSDEIMKKINDLTKIVDMLIISNDKLLNENKELKSRLDKLQEKFKKEKENLVELEEEREEICQYDVNKGPRVTNKKELFKYFKQEPYLGARFQFLVNDRVEVGNVQNSYILVNGVCYIFDDKERKKGEKLASNLVIYDPLECDSKAKYYSKKHDKFCCEDHMDYFD